MYHEIPEPEKKILIYLRNNSREKLTTLSRKINLPVSTIHDKIKKYLGNVILKSTVILDSGLLGYPIKAHTILKVDKKDKQQLFDFLVKNSCVNNLYKINNGFDFIVEGFFKTMYDAEEFFETMEHNFNIKKRDTYYIMKEIKRESFMTNEIF